MVPTVFDSTDLNRIEKLLSEAYTPMRIRAPAPRPRLRIERVAGPEELTADRVLLGFDLSYETEPLGKLSLCSVRSGRLEHRVDGSRAATRFGPGDVFPLGPPDRTSSGRATETVVGVTMFDPALLDQVVWHAGGPGPEDDLGGTGVRLLGHRPLTHARGRRLRDVLEHVRRVLADIDTRNRTLITTAAMERLGVAVLETFPHTRGHGPTASDYLDAAPSRVLTCALDYIDAHAGDPLTLAGLARISGVSSRGLQNAFRKHLETTPSAYLRRVRLGHVHRVLLVADASAGDTVIDIAMNWGFYHQGRFAAAYRALFGELPSETLRSGPGGSSRGTSKGAVGRPA